MDMLDNPAGVAHMPTPPTLVDHKGTPYGPDAPSACPMVIDDLQDQTARAAGMYRHTDRPLDLSPAARCAGCRMVGVVMRASLSPAPCGAQLALPSVCRTEPCGAYRARPGCTPVRGPRSPRAEACRRSRLAPLVPGFGQFPISPGCTTQADPRAGVGDKSQKPTEADVDTCAAIRDCV